MRSKTRKMRSKTRKTPCPQAGRPAVWVDESARKTPCLDEHLDAVDPRQTS